MGKALALLTFAALLLVAPAVWSQDVAISDKARELFTQGVDALEEKGGPNYPKAYEAFKAAYADSPTPKILGNIGLCAFHLERDTEAEDAYKKYLVEVDTIPDPERLRIAKDLEAMTERAARLILTLEPDEGVTIRDTRKADSGDVVNDYEATASPMTLRVHAGKHELEVAKKGYKAARLKVELKRGDKGKIKVKLVKEGAVAVAKPAVPKPQTKPKPKPSPDPAPDPDPEPRPDDDGIWVGVWIGVAITGALAVGAAITGGLALQKQADYELFQDGGSRSEAEVVRGDGEILNITTDALIGGAALFGALTIIALIVDVTGDDGDSAALGPRGVTVRF